MYKDIIVPIIEFKPASTKHHVYSVKHSLEAVLNDKFKLRIAPLELQIAYMLRLGPGKDVGNAVFLYELFKPVINRKNLGSGVENLT